MCVCSPCVSLHPYNNTNRVRTPTHTSQYGLTHSATLKPPFRVSRAPVLLCVVSCLVMSNKLGLDPNSVSQVMSLTGAMTPDSSATPKCSLILKTADQYDVWKSRV